MRARAYALLLAFAAILGASLAAAPPAAAANQVLATRGGSCWFSTSKVQWTPIKWSWIRSSTGGSRHGYQFWFGAPTGTNNDERITDIKIWQSQTPFGPELYGNYSANFGSGIFDYTSGLQGPARFDWMANSVELHLNAWMRRNDGATCKRQARITATGYTWDG